MNISQVVKDTAHATQPSGRAHWRTGAKSQRTPHTQHNTPSGHTGEQEPSGQRHRTHSKPSVQTGQQDSSGPGHRARNTTHRASTPVNRSQEAKDTAHATQHTKRTPHAGTHPGQQRDRAQQTTPKGSDALGRPGRPPGPVAREVLHGHLSEPSKAASGTIANDTRSCGDNR